MPDNASNDAAELIANAAYIGTPGKGILVADESTGTNGKHLCELLFPIVGALQYFSGVILSEETLYEKTASDKHFVKLLKENGVCPGIKVDKEIVELLGSDGKTHSPGLDGFGDRCKKYYEAGARFAECRAVPKISLTESSQLAIDENAYGLARYAIICQQNGLVPIVEPEILVDGPHDINKSADVTERVLAACYRALNDHHVLLEGTLLKPNMVTPGTEACKVAPEVVAEFTVRTLQRTVPAAVPAIVFLSGEEEATLNLNAMNKLRTKKPWSLSFSCGEVLQQSLNAVNKLKTKEPRHHSSCFGHTLPQSTLKAWEENLKEAQEAFFIRCKANSEATLGTYKGDATLSEGAAESLHVSSHF